jgi:hypothetical protein
MSIKPARLFRALTIVGAVAATAAPGASAAVADTQQATSENWAGYVAGASSAGTGTQFSSVSGSWVAPTVKCTSGSGYSAFWVGLGGAGQQSQALEQVGTEADCASSGAAGYFAWYELVPSAPVRLGLKIRPGDHISARVTVNASQVTVNLSDQTNGTATTRTLSMSDPDTSSAEWIAEAPSSCDQTTSDCQPLPLADFGTVGFTDASATSAGHTGSITDSQWASARVALSGAANDGPGIVAAQTSATAQPSSLSSEGSAFSVAYSAGADSSSGFGVTSSTASGNDYGSGGAGGYGSYGGGPGNGIDGNGGYPGGGYGYGGYGYGGYGYDYGATAGYGYGGGYAAGGHDN